jgi:proteasome lid subunit RPN8/RPN11
MLAESRIRLAPLAPVAPRRSRIPVDRGRRWRSAYDDDLRRAGVTVFMTEAARCQCYEHAASDLRNEVGGALVGKWRADGRTGEQYVVVEAALPARHTRQGSVFLTFTQDSLVALHNDLDECYAGKELVGWYHTHPRMGVFLSGYDVWLHEHFFPEPWQVALVIEPHAGLGGFFLRQTGGRLDPQRYFGFYELVGGGQAGRPAWSNLSPDGADGGRE